MFTTGRKASIVLRFQGFLLGQRIFLEMGLDRKISESEVQGGVLYSPEVRHLPQPVTYKALHQCRNWKKFLGHQSSTVLQNRFCHVRMNTRMYTTKTAFTFIPGAWCPGYYYHKVTEKLQSLGYSAQYIDLPSVEKRMTHQAYRTTSHTCAQSQPLSSTPAMTSLSLATPTAAS